MDVCHIQTGKCTEFQICMQDWSLDECWLVSLVITKGPYVFCIFAVHCHLGYDCVYLQNQSDTSPEVPSVRLHVDEERLPFRENMFDLVISSLRYYGTAFIVQGAAVKA